LSHQLRVKAKRSQDTTQLINLGKRKKNGPKKTRREGCKAKRGSLKNRRTSDKLPGKRKACPKGLSKNGLRSEESRE